MEDGIRQSLSTLETEKRAFLISVYEYGTDSHICEEHLEELALLCKTFGLEVVHTASCCIRKYDASTFITSGKLEAFIQEAKAHSADLIVFDDEISPAQQRNLEKAFNIPVIDRTEVILGVFAERAHTKEAQLQVKLAQMKYQTPRLKRMWTHLSRQKATSGGGGYLKGEGEKQIEIDRRLIKKRMGVLQREIEAIKEHRHTQRRLREKSGIPVFAIIGYTNAGKSTLLNALTDADVFVEDKLFATLDTTTRKYLLPNHQEILLTDTVGFIRKLPHLLVAAFRSTLEEAAQADILIHLIDASHPMAEEQADATYEVLQELNAEKRPILTVLNKWDQCEDPSILTRMRIKYPKTIAISALKKEGFDTLIQLIIEEIEKFRQVVRLKIPQKDYHIVSQLIEVGQVLHQEYEGNDILMRVEVPKILVGKLEPYRVEE